MYGPTTAGYGTSSYCSPWQCSRREVERAESRIRRLPGETAGTGKESMRKTRWSGWMTPPCFRERYREAEALLYWFRIRCFIFKSGQDARAPGKERTRIEIFYP